MDWGGCLVVKVFVVYVRGFEFGLLVYSKMLDMVECIYKLVLRRGVGKDG